MIETEECVPPLSIKHDVRYFSKIVPEEVIEPLKRGLERYERILDNYREISRSSTPAELPASEGVLEQKTLTVSSHIFSGDYTNNGVLYPKLNFTNPCALYNSFEGWISVPNDPTVLSAYYSLLEKYNRVKKEIFRTDDKKP